MIENISILTGIPEIKLRNILEIGVEQTGISLFLYDEFGNLVTAYPDSALALVPVLSHIRDIQGELDKILADVRDKMDDVIADWGNFIIHAKPVQILDEFIGTLLALSPQDDDYLCKHILRMACHHLKDFIAMNGELESFSSEIVQNYEELNLLYTFSTMLAGITFLEQVCPVIVESAVDIIQARNACILLLNEETDELRASYAYGMPLPDAISKGVKLGEYICGHVAESGESILIENEDGATSHGAKPSLFPPPLIVSPLTVKEKVLGVLVLSGKPDDSVFTSGALKLLDAIASQAAIAIMNIRLLDNLMQKNQKLRATLEQLKFMQEQLIQSQRLSAMGEVISGIEHEINNSLAGVTGYAELALRQVDDEKLRKRLEIILQEGKRAADIVRNLRTFARKIKIEKHPVSINEVVQSVLNVKEEHLKRKNISITTDLSAEIPETMADFGQLQQLLLNLMINAEEAILGDGGSRICQNVAEFATIRGTIHIKTEVAGQYKLLSEAQRILRIIVSDDGPGIPEDIRGRIFDPFFSTKYEVKGVGQGLPVCFGIVNSHGGRIYLESGEDEGSTFFVELPVVGAESQFDNSMHSQLMTEEMNEKRSG